MNQKYWSHTQTTHTTKLEYLAKSCVELYLTPYLGTDKGKKLDLLKLVNNYKVKYLVSNWNHLVG